MKILVINCGSSSIKYRLYEMPAELVLAQGVLEKIGEKNSVLTYAQAGRKNRIEQQIANHEEGLNLIIATLQEKDGAAVESIAEINAIGHRVVHGAEYFTGSVVLTDQVVKAIEDCCYLAPLHNPPNLEGIRAAARVLPNVPQVGCFDTAFHQTIPKQAFMYALPYYFYEKHKYRRYGFHGTSHRYVARRAAELMGKKEDAINCITCHLGNGCSITAVKQGKSVDTSMGLTPLEGLVMGTRSGDIDPAIIFFIESRCGMKIDEIDKLLNKKSGLLGLSELSNDVRELLQAAAKGHEKAALALDVFSYRIRKYIGSYAAVLGTLDAVVFTGGIGENASSVRAAICENMSQIGIELNNEANDSAQAREALISTQRSRVKVYVIPTNEEGSIAKDTYELVKELTGKK